MKFKVNKACGLDKVYCKDKNFFLKVFHRIWTSGKFPDIWKLTNAVLIPKEGKDLHLCDSYSPISLSPIWSKVMDKLITNRLETCDKIV